MKKLSGNKWIIGIFLFTLSLSLLARFYDLEMDTFRMLDYGTSWGDESGYVQNARNKVLFGEWILEGSLWNEMFLSPVSTFFQYISFKTLGVSTFAMRIVPALLGIISITFVSIILYYKRGIEGLIYFILLSINTFLIAYSRIAMLEYAILFFMFIILGNMIYNKKYSWILAGFFTTFLFFTKLFSMFFIIAIPLSLVLYYYLYKDKNSLKNLFNFIVGFLISIALWSFWLLPNLNQWIFMNFSFENRILLTLTKPIGSIYTIFQFSLINLLISVLVIISIFLIGRSLIKRKKVQYLDFFLIVALILFYLQISIADSALRRFSMIMPLILLMSARLISRIKEVKLKINFKTFKFDKNLTISLILLFYIFINFNQLGEYFYEAYVSYDWVHTRLKNSQDLNNFIPRGEPVYGSYALSLSSESGIRPYRHFYENKKIDNDAHFIQLFQENKISYAIFNFNLFDKNDFLLYYKFDKFNQSKLYNYIKNNFKIIGVIHARNDYTNLDYNSLYIYKKYDSKLVNEDVRFLAE